MSWILQFFCLLCNSLLCKAHGCTCDVLYVMRYEWAYVAKVILLVTTIEFWYSIPTVFKIGQFQSEYSPGIITVGIQSETFIPVVIQSHLCPCIGIGHENLTVFVSLEFWWRWRDYCSRNTVGSRILVTSTRLLQSEYSRHWNRNVQCRSQDVTSVNKSLVLEN